MTIALWILATLIGFTALAYVNASGRAWGAGILVALAASWALPALPLALNMLLAAIFIVLVIPLAIPGLRRKLISDGVLGVYRRVMPPMSQTESDALEAGTVWWDGELFTGRPAWSRLLSTPTPALTVEEQRFLDEETEQLCAMTSDWETTNVYKDLPPKVSRFRASR